MREDTLLRKSERGQREIAATTPTLSPKMRRLLIMADGRITAAQLAKMVPGPDGVAMLAELVAMGFIEPVNAGARAEVSQPPAAAPVATPKPPASAPTYERPSAPVAVAAARAPQLAVVTAAAPAQSAEADNGVARIKAELRTYLTEVLGADIALVQDKLEAVQDTERLSRFLTRCEDLVANYGGARKAADFRARFSAHY